MMREHHVCVCVYVEKCSGAVVLAVRRSRSRSWLFRGDHLSVHALDRCDSHTGPGPVVVDRESPIID